MDTIMSATGSREMISCAEWLNKGQGLYHVLENYKFCYNNNDNNL